MDSLKLEKGDVVIVTFKDHFTFDPDSSIEDLIKSREARKLIGFRIIGWYEGKDDDYIYIRFVRPLPEKLTPLSGGDGGFAILKSAIADLETLEVKEE